MAKQKKHIRRSKKGRKFIAGKGKAKSSVSSKVKRDVLKEHAVEISKELKRNKRVRIPDVGILKLKIKPATKGGKTITAFGKTFKSKAKPRRAVIKFSASKGLKEAIA